MEKFKYNAIYGIIHMKNKVVFLFQVILILSLFSGFVFADVGRHPTMDMQIKQNGENISGVALVCYDTFMAGADFPSNTSQDYEYLKGIDSGEFKSCSYCLDGDCHNWFYGLPTKFVILFPSHAKFVGSGEYSFNTGEEINLTTTPILYQSDTFQLSQFKTYDYKFDAILNQDKSVTLKNKTPIITTTLVISFVISLIITMILELIVASIYISKKQLSKRILLFVLLANLISLPIMWFVFPALLKNTSLFLLISEIFVFLLESLILYYFNKRELNLKQSFLLSFYMNIVSFLIGGIIFEIISALFGL